MPKIFQPIGQVRLTNVAVVRMNVKGKRFEIACYRNKVVDYRQGLEKDLSEVLQTDRIFANVSKGQFANAKDLQKCFGTRDEMEIAKNILEQGQFQVSDRERSQQLEKTTAQIAEWVSKNCVHPTSERPYTIPQLKHAMQQANFSVHPTKPLKRQCLDSVKILQRAIPIRRARMELQLFVPSDQKMALQKILDDTDTTATIEASDAQSQCKILVDPSMYRTMNEKLQPIGGRIEVLQQVVTKQGDNDLEMELEVRGTAQGGNADDLKVAGLSISSDDAQTNKSKSKNKGKANKQPASSSGGTNEGRKSCNTCGGFFGSAAQYRSHFKSDWHKFNQKLKMKNCPTVSEEEFMICDSDALLGGL
uniref:C2H2-type domain-containing protein n=1 Tax=Craspedostauros australis TaxID=1486917 RepID=A0A7R9ZT03_9STRA|mmetsp:Transcript_9261/g.25031  ORF Transcript_9261/g.25031 Transcript_9261/m.25031 type:complete len:362 (+) Transcript_9261:147-1232(+)|eukprot:CAMPEP_0198129402 /NCGR_PEP_ID=MMETSP1442-20131203/51646_1 /TAXON_ID= /ORGANISM="Craspedostauros australis, Strain CCMP3328" /LENGTH=361 /DNA_ID=CAMNT_0043789785 /DNA_START=111 /DNA_END=1196 /DNA_ORIENTATION=-